MSDEPQEDAAQLPFAFEWDWVRVYEEIQSDGTPSLGIQHTADISPWKLQGMLQAAADYYRTMTTNVFFGSDDPWSELEEEEED